jgi:hypothetical protein
MGLEELTATSGAAAVADNLEADPCPYFSLQI